MKNIYIFIALLFSILTMSSKSYAQDNFPALKGSYMGQKPPGMMAEPFAPGIISKDGWELEGVFAPGMKEFYYTINASADKFNPPLLVFDSKIMSGRNTLNSNVQVKWLFRLTASVCIWQKAIRIVSVMAGQNAKALAPCLTGKTGGLCA